MLVLSRKPNETIVVEHATGTVTITVQQCKKGRAKIGIEGGADVLIRRGELERHSVAGEPVAPDALQNELDGEGKGRTVDAFKFEPASDWDWDRFHGDEFA